MGNGGLHINSEFTFIDLFAGIGGIRIAFERIGGKCVFSSESDESCQLIVVNQRNGTLFKPNTLA